MGGGAEGLGEAAHLALGSVGKGVQAPPTDGAGQSLPRTGLAGAGAGIPGCLGNQPGGGRGAGMHGCLPGDQPSGRRPGPGRARGVISNERRPRGLRDSGAHSLTAGRYRSPRGPQCCGRLAGWLCRRGAGNSRPEAGGGTGGKLWKQGRAYFAVWRGPTCWCVKSGEITGIIMAITHRRSPAPPLPPPTPALSTTLLFYKVRMSHTLPEEETKAEAEEK